MLSAVGHVWCSVVVPIAVITSQSILLQPLSVLFVLLAAAGEWMELTVL